VHLETYDEAVASVVEKRLGDGSRAYLVRFRTADGHQRSKQFRRKRDADAYVNLVEVDRLQGSLIDPRLGRITVSEWYAKWWPTVTNLRPTTRARDDQYFRVHVTPDLGDIPLAKLERSMLRSWAAALTDPDGSGLAPATAHKVVQVLNKCVAAAVEDRLIPHNPVARLPLPRIERKEMRYLSHDDLWVLADTIDPRYRAFVLLGGYGGLRLGEMLGLRWGRVDLLRRRVQVAETLLDIAGHLSFGPPKTKAAVRSVPLPAFVCEELSRLATPGIAPETLVFRSPDGFPLRPSHFRRRFWNPAVRRADLAPLRIHDLRHTAVSLWIAEGGHPKQVAVLAGHTSVSVVLDRYGHLYPQQDEQLMAQLETRGAAARSRADSGT
jgi:integrase